MLASIVLIKIRERLNKLDSADYYNLECWQIREAFNKAQSEWVRRQLNGKNDQQVGDEETKMGVENVQLILTPTKLGVKQHSLYAECKALPDNCFYIKRVTPIVSNGKCKNKRIKSTLREEVNVDEYLQDFSLQPSLEFEETFHTMINNKIRVYSNGQFSIDELDVIYYRTPRQIDFQGCEHIDGKQGVQVDPEWKDDIVELIIDDAASILAGDIESPNQYQLTKQRSENNN